MPVVEPYRSRSYVGDKSFVAGWGHLKERGEHTNMLQYVQLPVLENAECKERFKALHEFFSEQQLGSSVICAGDLSGGHDSCQGDR